jgi:cyclase
VRQTPSSRHFSIERLGRGIYAAIANPTGWGLCNSTIIDLGGQSLVFDSMLTPMAGRALARAAERVTGHSPTWVVNSHWHGDHIWGNSSFPNGHVVSTRKVRDVVVRRSRSQFDSNRRTFPAELDAMDSPTSAIAALDRPEVKAWFRGVLETPLPFQIIPPEVTFRDELVLEGTRRTVHLLSFGGGHSPSDVIGYLPDEDLVLAGDLLMVGYHPFVGDGWPERWLTILRKIRRLHARVYVPGHGPIGNASTVDATMRYLSYLERSARNAARQGRPFAEFLNTPVPPASRRWRFAFMYPDNLARAYRLARQRASRT